MNVAAHKTIEWFRGLRKVDPKTPPAPIYLFMFRGMYRAFKKNLAGILGHGPQGKVTNAKVRSQGCCDDTNPR